MKKLIYSILFIIISSPFLNASWTHVQKCSAQNSTFFSTTTVGCTINLGGGNNKLIISGFSCHNTCPDITAQQTHSMGDTKGLTITNLTNTLFFDTGQGGNWARESVWCADEGSNTGNDTVTLTLNSAAGNGIVVQEFSGLASCTPIGVSSPSCSTGVTGTSCVQAHVTPSGGTPPILYTGGTITIGSSINIATVLAALDNNTDYLINFIAFQATSGFDLLFIYGDCDNCGGLFQNAPSGYTIRAQSIGDNDSVWMTGNANPSSIRHFVVEY